MHRTPRPNRIPLALSTLAAALAATPLLARTAVVAAEGDARVAEARAMALRAGGVRDVLVTRWARDRAFHDDILLRFWDRSNRRYNAIRSFAEARNEAIKEKPEAGPPPWWGGYLLTSRK